MSEQIKCVNQPIPAYSGITINITNPNLNAGPLNSAAEGGNFYAIGVPDNRQTEKQIYATNPNMTPNAYYSQAEIAKNVDNQKEAQISKESSTSTKEVIEKSAESKDNVHPEIYPAPYYINNYNVPQTQPVNDINQNDSANKTQPANDINQDGSANKTQQENINMSASQEIIQKLDEEQAAEFKLKQTGKKKRVVALTDEYIMSLENYLNNPNTEIRLMAAKDILTRFNEDRDRYDDAALNALLNKMLQDPARLVRIAALSALSSDLASGNEYTVEILNRIQQDPNSNQQDVLDVAQILLNRSAAKEIRYVQADEKEQKEEKQTEKAPKTWIK